MINWESFLETLETNSGFWNPILWLIALVIILIVVFLIRSRGKTDYKKGTEQTKAFLSGNPEYDKEGMHVKGSNLYWGFTESLKSVYKTLGRMHSGVVSDYVLWFVIIMAALFILVGVL